MIRHNPCASCTVVRQAAASSRDVTLHQHSHASTHQPRHTAGLHRTDKQPH
jgi:hypothetical protein